MKRINTLVIFFAALTYGLAQNSQAEKEVKHANSGSFGMPLEETNVISDVEMTNLYEKMSVTDTLQTKFMAEVVSVCQAKGCWMKLALQDGKQTMVRFKDYGFFMPKDITGKTVVVNGKAFVEEMSIQDQKHYASDAGKSQKEIAKITSPKKTFSFKADGVLIKE